MIRTQVSRWVVKKVSSRSVREKREEKGGHRVFVIGERKERDLGDFFFFFFFFFWFCFLLRIERIEMMLISWV